VAGRVAGGAWHRQLSRIEFRRLRVYPGLISDGSKSEAGEPEAMTRTVVRFRDATKSFRTEREAYIWMVDEFLRADVTYAFNGGAGALRFAPASRA
jgi:hypothetical protein